MDGEEDHVGGLAETLRSRGYSYLLMLGHLCTDINQGALAATLPFLVIYSGYSYTQVTLLVFASNIASAVIQPLFGWLGDLKARPWLMALGVALAGVGMCGVGQLEGYPLVVASAMVCGIGVAMFHPEGGRLANLVAGQSKAGGMSIFSVGGQVGFCVGPVMAAAALGAFGLRGTWVFLIPSFLCAAVLLLANGRLKAFGLKDASAVEAAGGRDRWGAFGLVMGVLSARSIMYYALTSFIALFMVGIFGRSETFGSYMITLFAVTSALATTFAGPVSRRVGVRRLTVACFVVGTAALVGFALSGSLALSIAMIVVLAVAINVFNPAAIALGQGYVPQHLGMASGLSFGVAVAVGGVVSPLLGLVGDSVGLQPVMLVVAGIAAVGLALSVVVARLEK